ncbi:hypothetical protein VKT23_015556 [Stygiomarasmius scandens]|uniref:Gustatory receptor n=1 Tax=Marasmiellus scandens TaxID=2682957 RepID=A0ABR1IZT0_9AGAR
MSKCESAILFLEDTLASLEIFHRYLRVPEDRNVFHEISSSFKFTMSSQSQQSLPLADADLFYIRGWIASTAFGFLLFGIYTTLSLFTIYLFLYNQQKTPNRKTLLFLTTFMLFPSTSCVIFGTEWDLIQISTGGFNLTQADLDRAISMMQRLEVVFELMQRINYLISDGIVVWRAWILFPHSLRIKLLLAFCMVGSVGGTFANAIRAAIRVYRQPYYDGAPTDSMVMVLPLLITNMLATGLIAYKAWSHHNNIKSNLRSSGSSRTQVEKILNLLVESGVIYCVMWISYLVIAFLSDNGSSIAYQLYVGSMPHIAALYPTLILLIAAHEKSREDASPKDMSLSQSIRFASMLPPATLQVSVSQSELTWHSSSDTANREAHLSEIEAKSLS